ncbi:DUF2934 domain-containing protein [Benzoatithermus flavus]|uniref:DUF2934 domain-containing protein n=1 Tax=Benzoatithermus flavus TaxID=3108223 RepID=A0ABU8XPP0_9PROT
MTSSGPVDADRIRQRAYELWEQDGRPEGHDLDYWLKAERDLAQNDGSDLGSPHGSGAGETGGTRSEPDLAPVSEGGKAPPRRSSRSQAKPVQGNEDDAGKPASAKARKAKPAAGEAATVTAEREEHVQQRRTRKKAEG